MVREASALGRSSKGDANLESNRVVRNVTVFSMVRSERGEGHSLTASMVRTSVLMACLELGLVLSKQVIEE